MDDDATLPFVPDSDDETMDVSMLEADAVVGDVASAGGASSSAAAAGGASSSSAVAAAAVAAAAAAELEHELRSPPARQESDGDIFQSQRLLAREGSTPSSEELRAQLKAAVSAEDETALAQLVRTTFGDGVGQHERVAVAHESIQLLNGNTLPASMGRTCVSMLTERVTLLEPRRQVVLVDAILEGLVIPQNPGTAFELLPPLLSALSRPIAVDCSLIQMEQMSMEEFQDYVVRRLCQTLWTPDVIMGVLGAVRELKLTQEQLTAVVDKLRRHMRDIMFQHLAGFSYQMLLLASQGQRELVLRALLEHFNELNERVEAAERGQGSAADAAMPLPSLQQLRQMQGSVLLHFNFAFKQDAGLGTALLGLVKSRLTAFTPFTLAVLLALARVQRSVDKVMNLISSEVLSAFRQHARASTSGLLALAMAKHESLFIDVGALLAMVQWSQSSWDLVMESVVQLGSKLMDVKCKLQHVALSSFPKSMPDAVALDGTSSFKLQGDELFVHSLSPEANTVRLGALLLAEVFKARPHVRVVVLEHVLGRIIVSLADNGGLPAIACLEHIIAERPHLVAEHADLLKDSLDYLGSLPPQSALRFVSAVVPVVRRQPEFRDYLIMVLRKAMFRREPEARLTALHGFLTLVDVRAGHNAVRSFSLSQASQSSNGGGDGGSSSSSAAAGSSSAAASSSFGDATVDVNLFVENMNLFRRGMTQQPLVRAKVYHGLHQLFSHHELRPYIFDMLLLQFLRYYPNGDSVAANEAPLEFDSCISNGAVMEPLHVLLSTVFRCVHRQAHVGKYSIEVEDPSTREPEHEAFTMLKERMHTLIAQVAACSPASFGLRHAAQFVDTVEGRRAVATAELVLGCAQACIESILREDPGLLQDDHAAQFEQLIRLHQSVVRLARTDIKKAKKKSKKKKKKKKKKGKKGKKKSKEEEDEDEEEDEEEEEDDDDEVFALAAGTKSLAVYVPVIFTETAILSLLRLMAVDVGSSAVRINGDMQDKLRVDSGLQVLIHDLVHQLAGRLMEQIRCNPNSAAATHATRTCAQLCRLLWIEIKRLTREHGAEQLQAAALNLGVYGVSGPSSSSVSSGIEGRVDLVSPNAHGQSLLSRALASYRGLLEALSVFGHEHMVATLRNQFEADMDQDFADLDMDDSDDEADDEPKPANKAKHAKKNKGGPNELYGDEAKLDDDLLDQASAADMFVRRRLAVWQTVTGLVVNEFVSSEPRNKHLERPIEDCLRILALLYQPFAYDLDPVRWIVGAKHRRWINALCMDNIRSDRLARAFVRHYIFSKAARELMSACSHLAGELKVAIGSVEDGFGDCDATVFPIINDTDSLVAAVTDELFSALTHGLEDTERLVKQIKLIGNPSAKLDDGQQDDIQRRLLRKLHELCKIVVMRLTTARSILTTLVGTGYSGKPSEGVLRVLRLFFKLMNHACRTMCTLKVPPSMQVQKLVATVAKELSPPMYNYVIRKPADDDDRASKARIRRERTLVPNLIYETEQYEHCIILWSKRSRVPLERKLKRAPARDFRVSLQPLEEEGEEEEEEPKKGKKKKKKKQKKKKGRKRKKGEQEEDEEEQGEEEEEEEVVKPKRRKKKKKKKVQPEEVQETQSADEMEGQDWMEDDEGDVEMGENDTPATRNRGGKKRKSTEPRAEDVETASESEGREDDEEEEEEPARKKQKKRRKKTKKKKGNAKGKRRSKARDEGETGDEDMSVVY